MRLYVKKWRLCCMRPGTYGDFERRKRCVYAIQQTEFELTAVAEIEKRTSYRTTSKGGPERSTQYPLLLTTIEDNGNNDGETHNRWKPTHSSCLNPRRSRHCTLTALRARPLKPHSCSQTSCPDIFLCSHRHVHNMHSMQGGQISPHAMLCLPWTKWE